MKKFIDDNGYVPYLLGMILGMGIANFFIVNSHIDKVEERIKSLDVGINELWYSLHLIERKLDERKLDAKNN